MGGRAEGQLRLGFVLDVELNVVADGVAEVGHRHPQSRRLDEVRLSQGLELLRRHVADLAVGPAHFLHLEGQRKGFHRAEDDGGDGGEENRRQGDGQHRDAVSSPGGGKAPPGQGFQHVFHGKFLLNLLLATAYQPNVTIAVQQCYSFVPFSPDERTSAPLKAGRWLFRLLYDEPIPEAYHTVGQLGELQIVGDHHQGLMKDVHGHL